MSYKSRPAHMTQGPVGKNLFKLTVPMMGGIYSFMLFNFVDAMYLGRLGALQLAAVSFTFPVALVVSSFGRCPIGSNGLGAPAVFGQSSVSHPRFSAMVTKRVSGFTATG